MIRKALKGLFVFAAAFGGSLFLFNEYVTHREAVDAARRVVHEVEQYEEMRRNELRALRRDAQAVIDRIDRLEGRPAAVPQAADAVYASFR